MNIAFMITVDRPLNDDFLSFISEIEDISYVSASISYKVEIEVIKSSPKTTLIIKPSIAPLLKTPNVIEVNKIKLLVTKRIKEVVKDNLEPKLGNATLSIVNNVWDISLQESGEWITIV